MAKKRKRKKAKRPYVPLSKYQKKGTVLQSPYSSMPFQMYDWPRDLLPEYLWIAAVIDHFGKEHAHQVYYEFMDTIDEFWPDNNSTPLGLLTDFRSIVDADRKRLWDRHEQLLVEYFHKPVARILSFYPDNPASWLVRDNLIEGGGHLDPELELGYLRKLVTGLFSSHDELATCATALAFGRLLAHDRIRFGEKLESVVGLLKKYPSGCTEREKQIVESLVRSHTTAVYMHDERYSHRDWPKYFWQNNLSLSVCRPVDLVSRGAESLDVADAERLQEVLQKNANRAREYLNKLRTHAKYDLYSPERGEILFGLFARPTRFYVLMTEVPSLWARDVAGILLRCLTVNFRTFSNALSRWS